MAIFSILFKFLVPIMIFYLIQKKLFAVIKDFQKGRDAVRPASSPDEVIEICPECGQVRQQRHRCKT